MSNFKLFFSLYFYEMDFFLFTFVMVTSNIISCTESQKPTLEVDLVAVTNFDGIEEYYRNKLKLLSPSTSDHTVPGPSQSGLILPPSGRPESEPSHPSTSGQTGHTSQQPSQQNALQELNEITKKLICQNIFTSQFFQMKRENWIDYEDEKNREELQLFYPLIFDLILEEESKNHAYQSRTITIGRDKINEFTFICLTKNQNLNMVSEYFVSREYNVNDADSVRYLNGRFIFSYNYENELVVRGLAEEPARPYPLLSDNNNRHEWHYFLKKRKRTNKTKETASEDPICQLTVSEKLRLCATVMNAPIFQLQVQFTPIIDKVELLCEKRRISFNDEKLHEIMTFRGAMYEEWMIGCKVSLIGMVDEFTYFISRGYGPNRAFLYRVSNEKFFVKKYIEKVSVVDENINMNSFIRELIRVVPSNIY